MSIPRFFPLVVAALAFALAGVACAQPDGPKSIKPDDTTELSEPTMYELLVGEIALQRGDYALAAKTYLDLARKTRDARVARRAVEVANQGKLPDLALEAAKTWQEIEPKSPAALQVVAALLISTKRVDEAEPYLEKLLSAEGVDAERGFLQLNRLLAGNPDKAANLRVVRQLAAKYPNLAPAHLAIAVAASAAGDDSAAIAAAKRAAEIRPDWDAPAVAEAAVLQKHSTADAAKRLGEFVEKNPKSREGRLNYARALILDKRVPEARKQFETLLAANPGNTDLVYTVGLLAFQMKEYAVAEDNMKKLVSSPTYRDPDQARYVLGQIAEEQKQWPQAIKWYDSIADGDQVIAARVRTAGAMAKQGKVDDARAFLQRVGAEFPAEKVQLTVAEAQLLRDANRNRDAYDLLARALKDDPDQPELLYDYALTAEKLERYDVLETNLRKLIKIKPDHAQAYNALGYTLADRKERLPEAKGYIEKALALSPDDPFILDSMGWVQFRMGNIDEAVNFLDRAYKQRPDPEIAAHLGEVLWTKGQKADAEKVWRESLAEHPDNEMLQDAMKRFTR
jgi:tetratricopeptide (TPR) repeat protein